jgi:FeS assembly protein IscX
MYQPELYWDATYAIVLALREHHPDRIPENIGLEELAAIVIELPGFRDDPETATEQMLLDILTVWYEEDASQ